jgi:DNA modification methylase
LAEAGFDLKLLAFDDAELTKLLNSEPTTGQTDEDYVPEPPKEAITQPGDLYMLGAYTICPHCQWRNDVQDYTCTCKHCKKEYTAEIKSDHRLLCGDSTKPEDVQRLMDGQSASLCFTSPPYNVGENSLGGNKNRVDSKYLNDDDDKPQDEYRQFLIDFTDLALKIARTVAVNLQSLAGNKVAVIEWIYHFRRNFVDRMIWYKGPGAPCVSENVMNSGFEDLWILSPEDNPKRTIPTGRFRLTVSNVYDGRGASGENAVSSIHAAVMPMHFALHVLSVMDGTGGIVYEPFAGSGTTLIAAEKLGRRCYGMELDPIYADVIVKRWEEFTGKKAIRIREEVAAVQ